MKFRKILSTAIIATGTGMAAPAFAIEGLSANIGVTSNYLVRGVTQTCNDPAVQGGLDYEHSSGLYVGTWASNVNFCGEKEVTELLFDDNGDGIYDPGDDVIGTTTVNEDYHEYEIDFYAGYAGEIEDFGYDIGYIWYAYPQSSNVDFGDVYVSGSYKWFTIGAFYGVGAEPGAELFEDALYVYGDVAVEVANGLTVGAHYGHQSWDHDDGVDYSDYNLSLTKTTQYGDFSAMVSDTDLSDDETSNKDEDPRFVISYNLAFDL
jgi:hypothetical protein